MHYYYLIASLPSLSMEEPPPFDYAEFRRRCAGHLAAEDQAAIDAFGGGLSPGSSHPFARDWQAVETLVRNAVAEIRSLRRGLDPASCRRETPAVDLSIPAAVEEAYNLPNPLEREKAIDRLRWRLAGDLAGLDVFSERALLAFAVRLRLAERWAGLDAERGLARVEQAANTASEQVLGKDDGRR